MKDKKIMDSQEFQRKIKRLSSEIIDDTRGAEDLVLIGIRSAGAHVAKRIAQQIKKTTGKEIPVGILDITLYRDDFFNRPVQPQIKQTILDFDITGKYVILVDDVLWTGRTVRAALDHMIDFGRPSKVRLCVLFDRGYRDFPIEPNYTGKKIDLPKNAWVQLMMTEEGGKDEVFVTDRKPGKGS